jgi:branched-chain amino acid transport system permease protein
VVYRTVTSILSALFATLAGVMLADWLRYNGPDTTLAFEIMLNVLLIVVIGGMGTIYGAAIGAGLFVVALVLFLALLRIVNSPFGRVLQAIRENEFRAEAIGYRVVVYRTMSSILSALFATLAGAMLAIWLRYNGPDTTLSFEIMLDVLLIVVIGGMGTIYGAVVGSVLLVLAQNYLQDLMKIAAGAVQGVPVLAQIVSPDRWLLWLGILFVLSVYYFPSGVVGRLRDRRRQFRGS